MFFIFYNNNTKIKNIYYYIIENKMQQNRKNFSLINLPAISSYSGGVTPYTNFLQSLCNGADNILNILLNINTCSFVHKSCYITHTIIFVEPLTPKGQRRGCVRPNPALLYVLAKVLYLQHCSLLSLILRPSCKGGGHANLQCFCIDCVREITKQRLEKSAE